MNTAEVAGRESIGQAAASLTLVVFYATVIVAAVAVFVILTVTG